jgi:glutamate 5-kinase
MLTNSKIIVIKIGSSTLVDAKGVVKFSWLKSLAQDVSKLQKQNTQVVIVSSGAVALGRNCITNSDQKLSLQEKQAAAAVGQPILMSKYKRAFDKYKIHTAQILLTLDDINDKKRFQNAKHTFQHLLEKGIVPIINENDSVATEELKFGDNDRLSAFVAKMVSADNLIIFSDIDGLYTENPNKNKNAKHIELVKNITPEIKALAGGAGSSIGSGGMITKIEAAEIANKFGCNTIITLGNPKNPIKKLIAGGKKTVFKA